MTPLLRRQQPFTPLSVYSLSSVDSSHTHLLTHNAMSTVSHDTDAPLVLALADKPDHTTYTSTVTFAREVADSYDPVTQTSPVGAYAGTRPTVCFRYTGSVFNQDESYPTDDA